MGGGSGNFGYLAPDSTGTLQFVSILDKIDPSDRSLPDVWQTLVTPRGVFFRSYELLFRWDGKTMHVWHPEPKSKFSALSEVGGRVYTGQDGVGLQEILGDELRTLPGGGAYKSSSRKRFLYPYDNGRIFISSRKEGLSLYDGQKATPFVTEADEYLKTHTVYAVCESEQLEGAPLRSFARRSLGSRLVLRQFWLLR